MRGTPDLFAKELKGAVGFTGSRTGITVAQASELLDLLAQLPAGTWFHHGDCRGADAQAHEIAQAQSLKISVHPPINRGARAFTTGDFTHPEAPYMRRNSEIVAATSWLIATPNGYDEVARGSGTWATIREAKRLGKKVTIIFPNGVKETFDGF